MKDALGAVQSVLVLGGASDIGVAIAARLAAPRQATVVLAGRHPDALDEPRPRPCGPRAPAGWRPWRSTPTTPTATTTTHRRGRPTGRRRPRRRHAGLRRARRPGGRRGRAGDGAVRLARINYVGAVSAGLAVARVLQAQGHGTLVVLSSVAGERVRRANFIYGSSKAGLDGFAQGLGDALAGSGARVLIVRPGFVRTKMTEGRPAAPLSTTADAGRRRHREGPGRRPGGDLGAGQPAPRVRRSSGTCPERCGASLPV